MIQLNSIQTRLIGVALVFIVGTSVVMGIIGIRLTTRFLSVRFDENFKLLASYMSRNAELGVLLEDKEMLNRLIQNMLAQEDIQGAMIRSASGEVLVSQEKKGFSSQVGTAVAPIMSYQMGEESMTLSEVGIHTEVGWVVLIYSYDGLDQLKTAMAKRFIIISMILVFIPVVIYWLLARSIVAPLNDLLEVSREVSKGRMDVQAGGGKFSETQILASMFNTMLSALKGQQEQLEEFHLEMSRQRSLAEVGKFSTMIAHELKNPLSIMKGCIDILKKDESDSETRSTMFLYLEEEVVRINRLMEDFLLYSRPNEPRFITVEMNGFVRDLINRLNLIDDRGDVDLKPIIQDQKCLISCDPHLMERALLNMIRNARNISKAGDVVEVETVINGLFWKFMVKDNGPGITPANLQQIFEPFFTTRAKGTGLGLTITKDIVEAHGGEISAENRKEGGAVFKIQLPRLKVDGKIEIEEHQPWPLGEDNNNG